MNFLEESSPNYSFSPSNRSFPELDISALLKERKKDENDLKLIIEREKMTVIPILAHKIFNHCFTCLVCSFSDSECLLLGKDKSILRLTYPLDATKKISNLFEASLSESEETLLRWLDYCDKRSEMALPIDYKKINDSLADLGRRTAQVVERFFTFLENNPISCVICHRIEFTNKLYSNRKGGKVKVIPQSIVVHIWSKYSPPCPEIERFEREREPQKTRKKRSLKFWKKNFWNHQKPVVTSEVSSLDLIRR